MSWSGAGEAVLYLAAGLALGTVYFALLIRTVRLCTGQPSASRIVPLCVMRLAAAAIAFWVIAQQGAIALLLALLGFLLARTATQRWMRSP